MATRGRSGKCLYSLYILSIRLPGCQGCQEYKTYRIVHIITPLCEDICMPYIGEYFLLATGNLATCIIASIFGRSPSPSPTLEGLPNEPVRRVLDS